MAVDFFLKLEGVPGESKDAKHAGEIDILSWSWGEAQAGTFGSGGGGGAGKVAMQDFHFVMSTNKSTPKLMLFCATGEHVKKAILTVRKAGKEQQEYLQITMKDCLVSSFQTGGSSQGDIPTDTCSINFAEIEVSYKPQKADGTLDAAVKFGYNQSTNKQA
jgi:type VI secretion system secreted protein Hcp